MPVVSVILTTYNRSRVLSKGITSVLNQSYKDLELIVVDDGSTDDTEIVVKDIMLTDHRVKYLKLQTNTGICRARNTGISASSGIYIAFQDDDDEWLPDKLRKQVEAMETLPQEVGMVYCFMYRIKDGNKKLFHEKKFMPDETDLYKKGLMLMFRGIPMQTCLFRREVFDTYGYFDENIKAIGEDNEFLMRVSRDYKFFCISEPLVNYHSTKGSLTKDRSRAAESAFYIFKKYYDDIKRDWNSLAIHYSRLSRLFRKAGKKRMARKYKIKAWFFDMLNSFK